MSGFTGFTAGFDVFFRGLRADNSREYWTAHADEWESDVRAPFADLVAELEEEFGPLRIMRPHRDLRFSADKTPYKTVVSATDATRATEGVADTSSCPTPDYAPGAAGHSSTPVSAGDSRRHSESPPHPSNSSRSSRMPAQRVTP